MRLILFLLFAFVLCNSHSTEYQCDPTNREYVCLVMGDCLVGTESSPNLVEFNPRTQELKDGICAVFIQIKNLNGRQWFINVTAELKLTSYKLMQNGKSIIALDPKVPVEYVTIIVPPACKENSENRTCCYLIQTPSASTERNLAAYFMEKGGIKFSTAEYNRFYGGSTVELIRKISTTRGCDPFLINVKSGKVQEGESLNISTGLVGRNAVIDCMEKRADRLYIKRATDANFVEVAKVFCPDAVWAVENSDGKVEYLGEETFDLKCIRNYCKYCGRIYEQSCDSCEDIEYEDCMPKCPRNLWVRSGTIINSTIKCMPNKENNGEFGEWSLRSNEVDIPFLAGSCYTGPYPLREEHRVISNLSPSFSFRTILLVLGLFSNGLESAN